MNIERMRGLLAAALVGLFVALLAMFLALAGVISMALAQIVLAFAFLVGAVFIWWEALPNSSKSTKVLVVCGLAVGLVALDWWTLKQRRAHLYVSRAQFFLGSTSPQTPENFVNVIFRNEGEMDVHVILYKRIANGQASNDIEKQRETENKLFDGMLEHLSLATQQDLDRAEIELPAHGESFMSFPIPLTFSQISTMSDRLYFMSRITYTDENGTHHTDFCAYIHNKAEPIFYCKAGHNEAP